MMENHESGITPPALTFLQYHKTQTSLLKYTITVMMKHSIPDHQILEKSKIEILYVRWMNSADNTVDQLKTLTKAPVDYCNTISFTEYDVKLSVQFNTFKFIQ